MKNKKHAAKIAHALLKIKAVGFSFDQSIQFTSGMLSPVYVDNRKLPFHPKSWKLIIDGFIGSIEKNEINFEVVAGVESAGIPHSSVLGYQLKKPSVFVRKKTKKHGTKSKIEGGNVNNKQVILLEDLVTTGGSSLKAVSALRDAGAIVEDCLVIVSYGFSESIEAFNAQKVNLHYLTTFADILSEAREIGMIDQDQKKIVENWLEDPWSYKG